MNEPSRIRLFTPEDGPGVTFDGGWAGMVRGAPGVSSPWHHHGDSQAIGHVLSGAVRVECEPGGHVVEAVQGQYLYLPRFAVHRETSWGSDDAIIFVVRIGSDQTFEVEGPALGEPGSADHPLQRGSSRSQGQGGRMRRRSTPGRTERAMRNRRQS